MTSILHRIALCRDVDLHCAVTSILHRFAPCREVDFALCRDVDFALYKNVDFAPCRTVPWRRFCIVSHCAVTSSLHRIVLVTWRWFCTVPWRVFLFSLTKCSAHHYTARVNVLTACYLLQQMTHVTSNYRRVLCKHVLPILQYIKHYIEVVIQINHLFSLCQSFSLVIMYISHMFLYQRKCMNFYENASLHMFQDGLIFKTDCQTNF